MCALAFQDKKAGEDQAPEYEKYLSSPQPLHSAHMTSRHCFAALLGLVALGCSPKRLAPAAAPGEPPEFAGMLAAHQRWRSEVSVGPLTWSDAAARLAQSWADTLVKENCALRHNPDPERTAAYGENIYRAGDIFLYKDYLATPDKVVDAWGSEKPWYDAKTGECSAPSGDTCGHYTQVVWRDTFSVGCGRARCEKLEVWVCNYSPRGNWVGQKPY